MHAPAAATDAVPAAPNSPVATPAATPAPSATYGPPTGPRLHPGAHGARDPRDAFAPAVVTKNSPATNYLRTKVLTATPEQLQLMLYDGAIRFAEQGRAALQEQKFDQSFEAFTRAQNILTELQCTLRPEMAPDLCKNLASLYTFAYMRLVEANLEHDVKHVDEALEVLRYQRETWVMLMQQQANQKAAGVARTLDVPTAATVERLSVQG